MLTARYDNWIAPQIVAPGRSTPDGPSVAALVVQTRRDNALVNVDVIGVGASVYDHLRSVLGDDVVIALNGAEAASRRDKSGRLGFVNRRAELWWAMREALDPATGDNLALPPDASLLADLAAPVWKLTARGVQVESKEDIVKRLGRSPDRGDSAAYSLAFAWMHEPVRAPAPSYGSPEWARAEAQRMLEAEQEELERRKLEDGGPEGLDSSNWEAW